MELAQALLTAAPAGRGKAGIGSADGHAGTPLANPTPLSESQYQLFPQFASIPVCRRRCWQGRRRRQQGRCQVFLCFASVSTCRRRR